jgi:hypothetical protein
MVFFLFSSIVIDKSAGKMKTMRIKRLLKLKKKRFLWFNIMISFRTNLIGLIWFKLEVFVFLKRN